MNIKRRHFLQLAGSTVASFGLSQFNIEQANIYGKVLAQSTSRKVALLVGINKYSDIPLYGCLNDVDLQRYLLQYRFGFNKEDIHILTDEFATRQGILEAFEEYLINQTKPGDVVVFHYSGHGSRVFDPDPIVPEPGKKTGLNSTFVPIDSPLPVGFPQKGGVVKDIMGHTLFLLMSAVKSEYFTAVLDSCHSGGAARDILVRARDGGKNIRISPEEKYYQEKWLSKLNMNRSKFVEEYRKEVAKGVVMAATQSDQLAVDARNNGFSAGAFTYPLTQYLWQQTSTPESAVAYITQKIPKDFFQTPHYEVKNGYQNKPIYFLDRLNPPANAVVTQVTGNQATIWLGSVNLEELEQGTVFNIVGTTGKVTYQSRKGLLGTVTVQGTVKEGMLLRV